MKKENALFNSKTNRLTIVLFAIYLLVLFWILLLKMGVQFSYMESRSVNLIPFHDAFVHNGRIDFMEMIMNIIVFVPMGVYSCILFNERIFVKHIFFFVLVSFSVEALQFILRIGAFDITDIFTNTIGGVIGWIIFKALEKLFGSNGRAQTVINIAVLTGTVTIILFLLLLKTGNLWIKYQ